MMMRTASVRTWASASTLGYSRRLVDRLLKLQTQRSADTRAAGADKAEAGRRCASGAAALAIGLVLVGAAAVDRIAAVFRARVGVAAVLVAVDTARLQVAAVGRTKVVVIALVGRVFAEAYADLSNTLPANAIDVAFGVLFQRLVVTATRHGVAEILRACVAVGAVHAYTEHRVYAHARLADAGRVAAATGAPIAFVSDALAHRVCSVAGTVKGALVSVVANHQSTRVLFARTS